ncbi:hypothetical protein F5Y11DRAFT_105543 [Daldinia sp. FL1419]|nr:hypothetical protein F5Y11DRAFT_105543 [Daldinia sp. FL1419]
MMSFLDIVSRLLRLRPLQATRSTDRSREAGGGPSGADFFVAELELQFCPAQEQPPTKNSTLQNSDVVINIPTESQINTRIQLPETPEPALLYAGRGITSPSLLVLHPIDSASSFTGGSDYTLSNNSSSSNISGVKAGGAKLRGNEEVDPCAAGKQRESRICWREYWG